MNKTVKRAVAILSLMLLATTTFAAAKSYNIKDYGAKPSLSECCTESIQKAIDAANHDGGGTVIIPGGAYTTGTLFLKSNVTIKLERGTALLGSTNYADYADVPMGTEEPQFSKCIFFALGQENIKIIGHPLGEINGRGYYFKHEKERPKLFRIEECKGIYFEDVVIKNSGSWCVYFRESDNIHLYKCSLYNKENPNNDGMNYDGCSNVLIQDCNLQVEDDAICLKSSVDKACENFTIENCTVSSYWACFKMGTATKSVFKDITIRNCQFFDSRRGCIKILMVDGGSIDNVLIENVDLFNCGGPIFIRLGNRGRDYTKSIKQNYTHFAKPEGRPVGTLKNVTFRNITARMAGRIDPPYEGMLITGIPGYYIENVTMENIDFSYTGFGKTGAKYNFPVEREADYPEQWRFGILPGYGMYARHIKGLNMKNVNFSVRDADDRPAIVLDDVKDSNFTNFTVDAYPEAGAAVLMGETENVKFKGLKVNGNANKFEYK